MVAEYYTGDILDKTLEYNGSGYISNYYMSLVGADCSIRIEIDDELCLELISHGATMQVIKPIGIYLASTSSSERYYVYYTYDRTFTTVNQTTVEDKYLNITFGTVKEYTNNKFFWYTDYPFTFKKKLKIIFKGRRQYNFLINYVPA